MNTKILNPTQQTITTKNNSGEIDQETASRRGSFHGQSAGRRQAGPGVDLSAAGRERLRLEVDSCRHHAGELYQFYCV